MLSDIATLRTLHSQVESVSSVMKQHKSSVDVLRGGQDFCWFCANGLGEVESGDLFWLTGSALRMSNCRVIVLVRTAVRVTMSRRRGQATRRQRW